MKFVLKLAVFLTVCQLSWCDVLSDIPIPRAPLGTVYGNGSPTAPLQLEMFMEVLCGAVKAQWGVIRSLADEYGPAQLRLVVYQFPLPYHQYAFLATQTVLLVKDQAPGKFIDYMEALIAVQHNYYTGVSGNLTRTQALRQFAEVAEVVTGLPQSLVEQNATDYGRQAVYEWKLGASRGVSGTPSFFLNGARLTGSPESRDDWRSLLDSLLTGSQLTPKQTAAGSSNIKSSVAAEDSGDSVCDSSPGFSVYHSTVSYLWLPASLSLILH